MPIAKHLARPRIAISCERTFGLYLPNEAKRSDNSLYCI